MTSSYKRLTIKRFPRVQERETAEARYWRNFTNPEVQVRLKGPDLLLLAMTAIGCELSVGAPLVDHVDPPNLEVTRG